MACGLKIWHYAFHILRGKVPWYKLEVASGHWNLRGTLMRLLDQIFLFVERNLETFMVLA